MASVGNCQPSCYLGNIQQNKSENMKKLQLSRHLAIETKKIQYELIIKKTKKQKKKRKKKKITRK